MGHFKATSLQYWSRRFPHHTATVTLGIFWITFLMLWLFILFSAGMAQYLALVMVQHTSSAPLSCSHGLETEQYLNIKQCPSGVHCVIGPTYPSCIPHLLPVIGGVWERLKLKFTILSDFNNMLDLSSEAMMPMLDFQDSFLKHRQKVIHTQTPTLLLMTLLLAVNVNWLVES